MFTANTELKVSELDFDTLKSNFKEFIQNKTEFQDYNFEGSALNFLLDVLAYNSYVHSFVTNMGVNENFLDTAQLRSNVVSSALKLGYVPYSEVSAYSEMTIQFDPPEEVLDIVIPAFSKFTSTIDSETFHFYTLQDYNATSIYNYVVDIVVYEGFYNKQTFDITTEKKTVLDNTNIFSDSIKVKVFQNSSTTDYEVYTKAEDITDLSPTSKIYYEEEDNAGRRVLIFGDGVLGKKLVSGNRVIVEYLVSSGDKANGVATFTASTNMGYDIENVADYYSCTIISTTEATGGVEKEGIESIRFNAPRYYTSQNRLVTKEDYKNYIFRKFPEISSAAIWGGETYSTPIPGRVVLSLKPRNGFLLSTQKKEEIAKDLKKRNVLSIEPVIVEPSFTYVVPEVTVYYKSRSTTLSPATIINKVKTSILNFESTKLGVFGSRFSYSSFMRAIDTSDNAIDSNETTVQIEKRFAPVLNTTNSYRLRFSNAIKNPYSGYYGAITSTRFKINTNANFLYMDDDGAGLVKFYYIDSTNKKKYLDDSYGTVDYANGIININSVNFVSTDSLDEISVYAQPESNNIDSDDNMIMLMANAQIQLYDLDKEALIETTNVDNLGNISPISASNTITTITL